MPAMQAWQLNPDHLRQAFQDVLAMFGDVQVQPIAAEQKPTAETASNQWSN